MNKSILFSAMFIAAVSCKQGNDVVENRTPDILKVKTCIVEQELYKTRINSSGRISAEVELKLSFKTGGLIGKIFVVEGQKVKKGMILASLDLREIKAKAEQANLSLEKSKRDFKRVQNLYNDSVATLEQYQDAKTGLEYAKTNLEIAKFNLDHSKIIAPENGVILKKNSEENEMVGSGQPVILFGTNEKSWIVKTSVTDNQVVQLQLGDKAKVFTDAYPDTFFMASVIEISNFADPYTSVFDIKLQLYPTKLELVSGLITKNEIITKNSNDVLKIPFEALINANGNHANVFKVAENTAVKCEVEIFKILDNNVLIRKGISKGDIIITENVGNVKDGEKIAIEI